MRRAVVWAAALAVAVVALAAGGAATTYTHGYDVSWPQCSGRDGNGSAARSMPTSGVRYLILGLTHGAGHTVNPCLGAQLAWARSRQVPVGAYLVPSYPTAADLAAAAAGRPGSRSTRGASTRTSPARRWTRRPATTARSTSGATRCCRAEALVLLWSPCSRRSGHRRRSPARTTTGRSPRC